MQNQKGHPTGVPFCCVNFKLEFVGQLRRSHETFPGGKVAERKRGRKRNAGENVTFLHLYRLLPVLWISPFHFRLPFGHPPSPRVKVCGFAAEHLIKLKFD